MNNFLVIDRNTLSRESIVNIIYCIENESVVYESESLEQTDSFSTNFGENDIVIFHPEAPQENYADQITSVCRSFSKSKIIVYSHSEDYQFSSSLFEFGVDGVLAINAGRNELITAIRSIKAGKKFISPSSFKQINSGSEYNLSEKKRKTNHPLTSKLTNRQTEILQYLVKGYANKLIAYELGVAEGTVKLHVSSILRALKVTNRTEAAIQAGQYLQPSVPH